MSFIQDFYIYRNELCFIINNSIFDLFNLFTISTKFRVQFKSGLQKVIKIYIPKK